MKHIPFILTLLIFPLVMAACAGEESDVPGTEGPALIMFYTDN